jgi:hypothetical protein
VKIWVYVEGESDRLALEALWKATRWLDRLRAAGHGIKVVSLEGKSQFFERLGYRAAEKLTNNNVDRVVGLPDLYPNAEYDGTRYRHADLAELQRVQTSLVREWLDKTFSIRGADARSTLARFHPSALKHDLEMLLLAAQEQLRVALRTTDSLGHWRKPVEDQNQQRPPKRIVEELFRTKLRRGYRATRHAPSVLRQVADMRTILYYTNRAANCPVFREMLDYIGDATGVPAYEAAAR